MTETLEARFEDITEVIREAIHQTNIGNTIDLKDVDKKIQRLVADVSKADAHSRKSLERPMAEMIARLDELEQSLSEHKTRLKEQK